MSVPFVEQEYSPPVRPLPPGPWWTFALGMVVFFGGLMLAGWLWSLWPLVIAVAGMFMFRAWRGVRCPICDTKLVRREVPLEGGPARRLFYECPECLDLWDSGTTYDPTYPAD